MKNVLLLTAAATLFAAPAFAGSTSNRITNGYSNYKTDTSVKVNSYDVKHYSVDTLNVKIDAVGENAGVNATYYNGYISGRAFATNVENPDPFVNIGEVRTSEYGTLTTSTEVEQNTWEKGGETFIEYTLTTDGNY